MNINQCLKQMLENYNIQQIRKIQDFLLSEIDDDILQETIDFVKSSDEQKKEKYEDILYIGNRYSGVYLEGNQYLISSSKNEVLIIDVISEEMGVKEEKARLSIPIEEFIFLISNKRSVIDWIKKKMDDPTIFD